MKRFHLLVVVLGVAAMAAVAVVFVQRALSRPGEALRRLVVDAYETPQRDGGIRIDYPRDGTIFPPDLPPPTFRWSNNGAAIERWAVHVALPDAPAPIETVEPHWRPDAATWRAMQRASSQDGLDVLVVGVAASDDSPSVVAAARTRIRTSADPVGAPILYRDVPLPFAFAVKNPDTIRWRLLDTTSAGPPPVVLEGLPVCGNCHSSDAAGNVLGMDVDYANDKGSYAILDLKETTTLSREHIITWSGFRPDDGQFTFGLLSRVSPDGRYVVSTVKDRSVFVPTDDLSFSQLFFPIKGILAVYDRDAKRFRALPGADDPQYVQSNPTFSPDGKWVYFCRAPVAELSEQPEQKKLVITPHLATQFLEGERDFRFDIYRVPFNGGAGGAAEPVAGASNNGKSNYFPVVSPDGRWLVFCQAENFMLLQPDSALYIVPADGGEARRMTCNTSRMNSWHAFSPNGRWLVFATKEHGPYTQLALAHIDERGRDAPPVLLEQAILDQRACNIPEFINRPPGEPLVLHESFLDSHNFARQGQVLLLSGESEQSIPLLEQAVALDEGNHDARLRLAVAYAQTRDRAGADRAFGELLDRLGDDGNEALRFDTHCHAAAHCRATGRTDEAIAHYRAALGVRPAATDISILLALTLAHTGNLGEAADVLDDAAAHAPDHPLVRLWLGKVLTDLGRGDEARPHLLAALDAEPATAEDGLLIAERLWPHRELASRLLNYLKRHEARHGPSAGASLLAGKLHLRAGRRGMAADHLREAYELDPSLTWIPGKIAELEREPGTERAP